MEGGRYQYLATGWSLLFLPPYLLGDRSNKGDGRYFPYNINPLLTKVTFLARVTFVTFLAISAASCESCLNLPIGKSTYFSKEFYQECVNHVNLYKATSISNLTDSVFGSF